LYSPPNKKKRKNKNRRKKKQEQENLKLVQFDLIYLTNLNNLKAFAVE